MRATLLAALVFGLVTVHPDRGLAQRAGTGTAPELADDALALALWHIAAATHTRIGFQSIEFIRQGHSPKDIPAFPVSSREEALQAAVDANPRYEWRAIGDFVVVRPKTAWNDAGDPLNRRVSNLRVENATDSGALTGLREVVYTRRFAADPNPGKPVAFYIQSGTVLDAFNHLIQSADDVLWHAAYRPNARPDQRAPGWDLQLQLYDATGQRGGLASCPALPCVAKR
jgi:hypothetical protein